MIYSSLIYSDDDSLRNQQKSVSCDTDCEFITSIYMYDMYEIIVLKTKPFRHKNRKGLFPNKKSWHQLPNYNFVLPKISKNHSVDRLNHIPWITPAFFFNFLFKYLFSIYFFFYYFVSFSLFCDVCVLKPIPILR